LSLISRNKMRFFWWLRNPLYWWIRSRLVPGDPIKELGIDPARPIIYVMRTNSLSDLLVLEEHCLKAGMPLPSRPTTAKDMKTLGSASYIYLVEMNLLQLDRGGRKLPPSPLSRLLTVVKEAGAGREKDVQLVPVSVMWGRNPGKDERSIFKLLFFDDERAGIVQKFFIVLAQGRNVFVNVGKPISVQDQLAEGLDVDETARKINRVIRVHYQSQRMATLGPSLSDRGRLIETLLRTKPLAAAIEEESRKNKLTIERAASRARRYAMEIAADTRYQTVRALEIMLGYLWNRIFSGITVRHSDRLREIPKGAEIVYVPAHRSHMDYLLIGYQLYQEGLVTPHTAAGINLNFWPVGGFIRRVGGFYIRRSFGGNRLYAKVYNEYVHALLTRGHSVKFFPEGGRSRSGKLLAPKTGMLAMVVHSFLRNHERPIVFVPIFVAYDKVVEVRSYLKELAGNKKRGESVGQLLQARKILRSTFGQAYISVGQPIDLGGYLEASHPGWADETVSSETKPTWMTPVVQSLAREVMTRINNAAVVFPTAIVSMILLSIPHKAMSEEDILGQIQLLTELQRRCPYGPDITLPQEAPKEILSLVEKLGGVKRFNHPGGDVIYLGETDAAVASYYRNNLLHMYCLHSLVASFFSHSDEVNENELQIGCAIVYPLVAEELFLRWSPEEVGTQIQSIVDALVDVGMLVRNADRKILRRPPVTGQQFVALKILGRCIGQTAEKYSIAITLLAQFVGKGWVARSVFETHCQTMMQRISLLNGITEPGFADAAAIKVFLERLKSLSYLEVDQSENFRLLPSFDYVAKNSPVLLSVDMRHSISRTLNGFGAAGAAGS
jgi:glycerol-3-phosphate O-acyltransferase